MGAEARARLGDPAAELRVTHDLRYAGQAFELPVEAPPGAGVDHLRQEFERAHESRYGHTAPEADLELVTIRVTAALPGADSPREEPAPAEDRGTRPVVFGGERVEARVLGPGAGEVRGPAVVELEGATLVVPPGWSGNAGPEAVLLEAGG